MTQQEIYELAKRSNYIDGFTRENGTQWTMKQQWDTGKRFIVVRPKEGEPTVFWEGINPESVEKMKITLETTLEFLESLSDEVPELYQGVVNNIKEALTAAKL